MSNRFSRSREIRIGGSRRRPPVVVVLLAVSLILNVYLVMTRGSSDVPTGDGALTEAVKAVAGGEAPAAAALESLVVAVEATPALEAVDDDDSADPDDSKQVHVVIEGPVANAFVKAIGKGEGDRLALTAGRLLVWNLDVNKDPRRGDEVWVQYRVDPDNEAEVHIDALRYKSAKFKKSYESFRYQPEGWTHGSWFDGAGVEVPSRLESSPMAEYQQITSLLGDGRKHSGMDFKAPVGTPVLAPFDGSVRRVNWNWKYNGNSVEVAVSGGRLVRFLHLSEVAGGVQAGARVIKGQVIGESGNTGRSFAPHLHYEIVDGSGRVHDPLKVHGVTRRTLAGADLAAFETTKAALSARLDAIE
jgi:murein DD-endopeptidase